MDWTTSPFVALWFAVEKHDDARDGDMALWVYDRQTARLNLTGAVHKLKGADDYLELDDRAFQNRLVKHALQDGTDVLVPVRPRQFPRAVAQQSILTVSTNIGVARPARYGSGRNWPPGSASRRNGSPTFKPPAKAWAYPA